MDGDYFRFLALLRAYELYLVTADKPLLGRFEPMGGLHSACRVRCVLCLS